jgi:hypothetical protein
MRKIIYDLNAPDIDYLIERFKPEWKDFYKNSLDRLQRREVRRYLDYRKKPSPEWSFNPYTEQTLNQVNERAKTLYWKQIRCTQLTIPGLVIPAPRRR